MPRTLKNSAGVFSDVTLSLRTLGFVSVLSVILGFGLGHIVTGLASASVSRPDPTIVNPVPIVASPTKDTSQKSQDEESPLAKYGSPNFTAVPMRMCPGRGEAMCSYTSCAASVPETTHPGKLWNAYVVSGKDGPVVICEWRDKLF